MKEDREEFYCSRENALDDVIGNDIKNLESVLAAYRRIREENDLDIDDLIKGNNALTTNLKLLEEASLYTEDLENKDDVESHLRAKEIFLFWCLIYCEKALFKRFSKNPQSRELVLAGTKNGVMYSYASIRNRLRKYFETPEQDRGSVYAELKTASVKSFMYNMAYNRTLTEFQKADGVIEIKIPEDIFNGCDEEEKKAVIEEIIEQYKKKGIDVFIGRDGNLYYNKYVSDTIVDNETGESREIAEVIEEMLGEIEFGAQKLMDRKAVLVEVKKVFAEMAQSGDISEPEAEFIRDVFFKGVSETAKIRELVARGCLPQDTKAGNYKRNVLTKMERIMLKNSKWANLVRIAQELYR